MPKESTLERRASLCYVDKTVHHKISECSQLAKIEDKTKLDGVRKVIQLEFW